jgi:hypothetical protein
LRLRQQTEQMARLVVSQARSNLNAADARLADARTSAARREADLESRLMQPGASQIVQQAQLELGAAALIVQQHILERTVVAERLKDSVDAYRIAQREREIVERVVLRHRDQHRRSLSRAAAIELQEWALRPKPSSMIADQEDPRHA